jgi:hypothetical protein
MWLKARYVQSVPWPALERYGESEQTVYIILTKRTENYARSDIGDVQCHSSRIYVSTACAAVQALTKRVFSGAFKSCVFRGPDKLPLKSVPRFTFLRVHGFTRHVASSPCHSLPTSLLSSFLPVLACARTRQKCDANARFSRVLFSNEALDTVLRLRELSNQPHATQSDAIK